MIERWIRGKVQSRQVVEWSTHSTHFAVVTLKNEKRNKANFVTCIMLRLSLFISACMLGCGLTAQTFLNSLAETESKQYNERMHPATIQAANTSDFVYQRCEWRVDPA